MGNYNSTEAQQVALDARLNKIIADYEKEQEEMELRRIEAVRKDKELEYTSALNTLKERNEAELRLAKLPFDREAAIEQAKSKQLGKKIIKRNVLFLTI